MKKIISLLVSIAMMFLVAAPAFADDSASDIGVTAYSPEFPDAYLEYSTIKSVSQYAVDSEERSVGSIAVTAFCEEAYDIETGAVIYSRLMNKDEVDEWREAGSSTEPVPFSAGGDIKSRGELTITLDIFPLANDGTSSWNTNLWARGQANWLKGPSWNAGATRPSWGTDVIAISWDKGLDGFKRDAFATSNSGGDVDISLCEYSDTEYVAWEFVEQFGFHVGPVGGAEWASFIQCSTGLGVPTSVYHQKADIALTYSHSYASTVIDDVNVSIEGSTSGGFGGGLEISFGKEVDDWTIIAIADGVDL